MASHSVTEGDILERIISSLGGALPAGAARSLLALRFPDRDAVRIRKLLHKNNAGTITAAERISLEKYIRVGQFLDLVHAESRLSLTKRSRAS